MNNLIKRVWTRKELVFVEDLRGMAFTNEDGAHTFSIAGKDENGADLALSGTVAGSLIRPDGTTTAMTGTIADGCANVTLSPECYGVSGRASLTIFLTSGGQKTAIYHAVMSIGKSSTSQVSPGVAADVVDLVNRIDTATASIPATYTALLGSIASDYSSSKTYKAGDYVWYDGYLYKAKQDIDTAESWASGHWTKVVLADDFRSEITSLKSTVSYIGDNVYANFKRIKAYIDSSGVVTLSESAYLLWCYRLKPGETINSITTSGQFSYGFFTAEPEIGSVTYNASRNVVSGGSIQNVIVPQGCSWIGVRVASGETPTFDSPPYLESLINKNANDIRDNTAAINKNTEDIEKLTPTNILPEFGNFSTVTNNGVVFTWNENHKTCVVNGTAGPNIAIDNLILYTTELPSRIVPGNKYKLSFESSSESAIGVSVYIKLSDNTVVRNRYTNTTIIVVPDNCVGITIRLDINIGTTVDNATVTLQLITIPESSEIIPVNKIAKMRSIGSSFLTGAIYPNGVFDHLCSFDNSPYGNVAIGLGILESNVVHTLVSSTGLLYDAGNGNILSKILEMDLSDYNYLLTQYNLPDLGNAVGRPGFPVGDLNSVAGDGSICGAVLSILQYMKTSNPSCTLILVGAPPSAQDDSKAYQNVFTAKYNNGSSIGEADLMLHRLAVREHFTFIDWEDLNLSYYYKDLTYGTNLHPEEDIVCRAMGMYLARNLSYSQSLCRVLQSDM